MRNKQKSFIFSPKYYEIIYRQKNYLMEAEVVDCLIQRYLPDRKKIKILDVGCGTGQHLFYLYKKGYQVSGLDSSLPMINLARHKFKRKKVKIELINADARYFSLQKKYDVIISLFHVLSYQNTNRDVINFFSRLYHHLVDNGLILFDVWYGPGVLTNSPENRYLIHKTRYLTIHRFKEPEMDTAHNLVRVKHTVFIENNKGHIIQKFKEIHRMRYFFYPEIKLFLKICGFKLLKWGQFGKRIRQVKKDSWEAFFIGKKS